MVPVLMKDRRLLVLLVVLVVWVVRVPIKEPGLRIPRVVMAAKVAPVVLAVSVVR